MKYSVDNFKRGLGKTAAITKELKSKSQDYEFYPTTHEIIEAMYWDLLGKKVGEETYRANGRYFTLLDIGAGNGKVFNVIKEIAQSQPLLKERYKGNDGREFEYTCHRNLNERYANRIFISKYMVIEKSQILLNMLPEEAIPIGTDFHENTLIDKRSDVVFCNPPYSEYVQWATKIIREANAKTIYLVIPQRWGNNKSIAQALKDRKAKVKIIGNFDFLNAEDRKARAKVSLVKIVLNSYKYRSDRHYRDKVNIDPFDLWFENTFKIDAHKDNNEHESDCRKEKRQRDERNMKMKQALVSGDGLISVLVQLYNKDIEHLIGNYQSLSRLDQSIFMELGINVERLLSTFKEKIKGLKSLYWDELFNNLSEITNRLTFKSRKKLQEKLLENINIDFTESNIRAIVIWVIKNANQYFKAQMLDLYDTFTTEEGIRLYKSNQHFMKDDFRYSKNEKKLEKYALDYRIIFHSYADSWDIENSRLSERQYDNIRDVITIAKNLGFSIDDNDFNTSRRYDKKFYYGEKNYIFFSPSSKILKKGTKTFEGKIEEVYFHTNKPNENGEKVMEKGGILYVYDNDNTEEWVQYKIGDFYYHQNRIKTENDIFCTVKPYKNGNIHFQFNKKFIKKLNLEVGRLRGWLKDPKHAAKEMEITVEEAMEYWDSNFTLLPNAVGNLLPDMSKDEAENEGGEEKILTSHDFENTPGFDPYVWWATSARYDDLKEGDMIKIIDRVEFQVAFNGKKYYLIDTQGAYLGDINKDEFDSILECVERLEGYYPDYFGAKFDCNCSHCGKALTEDDEAYESHDGKPLCDACAILCEGCDKYYTKDEGEYIDMPETTSDSQTLYFSAFRCNSCKENIDIPEITLDSQMLFFAKEVLKHFRSGDVFGGIKEYRDGKLFSTSYVGAYQLFKINEEYKKGNVDGITVSYKRDSDNNVIEFELTNVFYDGKVPFQTKNTFCKISMKEMKKMILEADNSIEKLQRLLLNFVKLVKHIPKTLFDFAA